MSQRYRSRPSEERLRAFRVFRSSGTGWLMISLKNFSPSSIHLLDVLSSLQPIQWADGVIDVLLAEPAGICAKQRSGEPRPPPAKRRCSSSVGLANSKRLPRGRGTRFKSHSADATARARPASGFLQTPLSKATRRSTSDATLGNASRRVPPDKVLTFPDTPRFHRELSNALLIEPLRNACKEIGYDFL